VVGSHRTDHQRCIPFHLFHYTAFGQLRELSPGAKALEEQVSILAVHLEETEVPDGLRLNVNNRRALFRYNDSSYRSNVAAALVTRAQLQTFNLGG